MSDIVNDALREALLPRPSAPPGPFRMPTYGDEGHYDHEPAHFTAALTDEE